MIQTDNLSLSYVKIMEIENIFKCTYVYKYIQNLFRSVLHEISENLYASKLKLQQSTFDYHRLYYNRLDY